MLMSETELAKILVQGGMRAGYEIILPKGRLGRGLGAWKQSKNHENNPGQRMLAKFGVGVC